MSMFDIQISILILKICCLSAIGWCLRLAIGNLNPKGIVFLWRAHFVALLFLCAGSFSRPIWNLDITAYLYNASTYATIVDTPLLNLNEPAGYTSQGTGGMFGTDRHENVHNEETPLPSEADSDSAVLNSIISHQQGPLLATEALLPAADTEIAIAPFADLSYAMPGEATPANPIGSKATESVSIDHARTLSNGLMYLWMTGVVIGLCRLVVMYARTQALQRRSATICIDSLRLPPWLSLRLASCGAQVKVSECVTSPCLIGLLSPKILLPSRLVGRPKERDAINAAIAHELMHVKGCDMLWHILLQTQQTVFWPLPLIWWIPRSHLFGCERVCDETAAALIRDRAKYRSNLAKLAIDSFSNRDQAFWLSMVKRPEITMRLSLLGIRPPVLKLSILFKSTLVATVLLGMTLGVIGLAERRVNAIEARNNTVHQSGTETPAVGNSIEVPTNVVSEPKAIAPQTAPVIAGIDSKEIEDRPPKEEANQPPFLVRSDLVSTNAVRAKTPKPNPENNGQIIRGCVTDKNGAPIANASLTVGMFTHDIPSPQKQIGPIPLLQITTDSSGNWQWDQSLAWGILGLRVAKDGFVSTTFEFAKGRTIYDVQLDKTISVKGTLVDESGQPVEGAKILAGQYFHLLSTESANGKHLVSPTHTSQKLTDSVGAWQIDNWQQESVSLIAIAKDGRVAMLEDVGARAEQVLKFHAPKSLKLRIVNSAKSPVSGAKVRALGWWRDQLPHGETLSDANGEIVAASTSSATVSWLIEKSGYRTTRFTPSGESAFETISMLRPQTITAQVVDEATGKLITNSRLICDTARKRDLLDSSEKAPVVNGIATSSPTANEPSEVRIADGNIRITNDLDFQFLTLTIRANGYQTLRCDPIPGQEEQVTRKFRLKRDKGFSVVDAEGKPAANCFVLVNSNSTQLKIGRAIFPEETIRADHEGRFSLPPATSRYTRIFAWTDKGYAQRQLDEIEIDKPLILKPWASLTIIDDEKQLHAHETLTYSNFSGFNGDGVEFVDSKIAKRNRDSSFLFPMLTPGDYVFSFTDGNTPEQRQTSAMRVLVPLGGQLQFKPLGTNQVRGQLDLATLGQPFLSKHIIRMQVIGLMSSQGVAQQDIALVHQCVIDDNGEFCLKHLREGNYRLRLIAIPLEPNADGERGSGQYPFISCDFEFGPNDRESEKQLGRIACVFRSRDLVRGDQWNEPMGTMERNPEEDDFTSEQPVRFVTTQNNWPHQEVVFWSKDGKALRKISKKFVAGPEGTDPLELIGNHSQFILSCAGEISAYNTHGTRVSSTRWNSPHRLSIAGLRGEDIHVYSPSKLSHVASLSRTSAKFEETKVPMLGCVDCKYSTKDGVYWTLGQKLRSFDEFGNAIVSVELPGWSSLSDRITLDDVNGGCWCISHSTFAGNSPPILSRIDSQGKQVFNKYLARITNPNGYSNFGGQYPMATVGGDCFVAEPERIVRFGPDGTILDQIGLKSTSLSVSGSSQTLWALTDHGLCKIDITANKMNVEAELPSVTGSQLFVLD